ncbi:serine hydrolase domain-containing protein [Streptomyces olivaceoviridis]|uniref:serine hydrolase domain-containing protein n=1 Tax=Streptomyces olivaceoviridis TaxID=1921 RepID=UPI00331658FE
MLSEAASPTLSDGHAVDCFVQIGSLTKVVTGTVLTRMAASGVLPLDDPLDRWLPTAPRTGITLLHLARHTSGLPRLPPGRLPRRDPYAAFDRPAPDRLLPRIDTLLTCLPGRAEEYSNLGYAVLGAALTAASRMTYAELVTEYVLRRLNITEITANPDPAQRLLAPGFLGRPRKPWTTDGAILPAGDLWATPRAAADIVGDQGALPMPPKTSGCTLMTEIWWVSECPRRGGVAPAISVPARRCHTKHLMFKRLMFV